MNLQNAKFIRSAAAKKDFPKDGLQQIVFAGRSNVGKSSVINRLLGRKNFARVGASPGKTTHINFFLIDDKAYFVDLPGYGYAKVSKAERARWGKLIESYFAEEDCVSNGVLVVDSRHKPTENDRIMSDWFLEMEMPFVVVANKCDKLKKSEISKNIELIRETLDLPDVIKVILFSAEKGTGKEELLSEIFNYRGETV